VKKAGPNLPASARAKLLNLAKATGEEFQSVLVNYAVERLLFRLGESRHRDRLVLKGAQHFRIWLGELHRPTRDLDLLGSGSPELDDVAAVMREVAAHPIPVVTSRLKARRSSRCLATRDARHSWASQATP
jgi:predicted nucleotidyltransferase component of viral defense system